MDDFQLETKVREIIYELSQPTMMRLSDVLRQLDIQQLNLDDLKQSLRQINETQQTHQIDATRKFTEIDAIQKHIKKIETDQLNNIQTQQLQGMRIKTKMESIEKEFEAHESNSQFVINSQLKIQAELEQMAKKQAEHTDVFNKKIDEFFKDYYTFFVESRNQVNKITKDQQLLNKDVQNLTNILDQFNIFKDSQITQNSSVQQRVEWISNELNTLVNLEYFKFTFDKEQKSRMEDVNFIKSHMSQVQNQLQIQNTSLDERMKGLELFEIQYRQQLNQFQYQLNQVNETYQTFYKDIIEQLSNMNGSIKIIESYQSNIEQKVQQTVNGQTSIIALNLNNQIKKINEQFSQLKATIAKDMAIEFNYKLDDIRQMILNESQKQVSIKLSIFEQQLQEIKNKHIHKDVEVQVFMGENNLSQQEEIRQFIKEVIENKFHEVPQKIRQPSRRNSIVNVTPVALSNNLQNLDNQKLMILNEQINDQLEDIKTDIQMLFEMREELEQKFKVFEIDFSVGMQNFDRNHSQVLKLKSDVFNDTEYLNSQIKILFREKDIAAKKFGLLLQLIAGNTEVTQIIICQLLKQFKDPIKFISDLGQIFEQRTDICNYRQTQYSLDDLLKKAFQSLIDFWDKSDLLEVREYNPTWYFQRLIGKQKHNSLSKTLDRSFEKTIKCTTQTIDDEQNKRSQRSRNISLKQQLTATIDSGRQRKVTVRSIFKQQEESVDGLPKVLKK